MNKLSQRGAINVLLIPFIMVLVFFFAVSGFGFWAFSQRSHYKNDTDQIVNSAVQQAVTSTQQQDATKYAEQAKQPLATYISPAAYGNITVNYPKTWSAYVIENTSGGDPVNGYFQPKFVPNVVDSDNSFALRINLVQDSYDAVLSQYKAQLSGGKITIAPYTLPKVASVVGSRIEGQITPTKQGVMIILPLRNMTLKVWTESNDFKSDLDTNILPNLSFTP